MNKFQKLKEAVKNPPPERLAAIEYRSHALNILGVLTVSIVLIFRGFWYIIFAFIFMVGVSYSQMMTSYSKYKAIRQFNPHLLPDVYDDPSPSRRRSRIVDSVLGKLSRWVTLIFSFVFALFIIYPPSVAWYGKLSYVLLAILIWIILYFFVAYWFAFPIYKETMKGGKENATRKKE